MTALPLPLEVAHLGPAEILAAVDELRAALVGGSPSGRDVLGVVEGLLAAAGDLRLECLALPATPAEGDRSAHAGRGPARRLPGADRDEGWLAPTEVAGRPWAAVVRLHPEDASVPSLVVSAPAAPDAPALEWLHLVAVLVDVLSTGDRQQAQLDSDDVIDDVYAALLSGRGHEGLVEVLHAALGARVVVLDGDGRVLAARPDREQLPPWPLTRARDGSVGRTDEWDHAAARGGDGTLAIVAVQGGHLGAPDGRAGAASSIRRAAVAAALESSRLRTAAAAAMSVWGELAGELLFDPQRERADTQARRLGLDPDAERVVALVDSDGSDPGRLLDVVRWLLRTDHGPAPLVTRHDDHVAAIVAHDAEWRRVIDGVTHLVGPCRVALSNPCAGFVDLPDALVEAEAARALGAAVGDGHVSRFETLGVIGMLAKADPDGVMGYVEDWLGTLREYDLDHRSELVTTLATYLEHGGSLDHAARCLHLHRSTLKYRLGRIRELTGLDLSEPEVRFNLQLATRADAVVRRLRSTADAP